MRHVTTARKRRFTDVFRKVVHIDSRIRDIRTRQTTCVRALISSRSPLEFDPNMAVMLVNDFARHNEVALEFQGERAREALGSQHSKARAGL